MVVIYTDGGCHGNPGPGGWAYLILREGTIVSAAGSEPKTTNNRMELLAVIRALEAVAESAERGPLCIRTDSQYVQKGISQWIRQWERNGWLTISKKPVKNQEFWMRLKALSDQFTVQWDWVAGHSTDKLNQVCDTLVQAAIKSR